MLVSPVNKSVEGSLTINQQAYISMAEMDEGTELEYALKAENGAYVFLIEGQLELANEQLNRRDAIGIWETEQVQLKAKTNSTVLLVEVPMN